MVSKLAAADKILLYEGKGFNPPLLPTYNKSAADDFEDIVTKT